MKSTTPTANLNRTSASPHARRHKVQARPTKNAKQYKRNKRWHDQAKCLLNANVSNNPELVLRVPEMRSEVPILAWTPELQAAPFDLEITGMCDVELTMGVEDMAFDRAILA